MKFSTHYVVKILTISGLKKCSPRFGLLVAHTLPPLKDAETEATQVMIFTFLKSLQ